MIRKKQNQYSKSKKFNQFDQKHFTSITKKRFKKRFGKTITATQINEIWKNWLEHHIVRNVLNGDCVKIDKHSTIQVIGKRITDDSKFMRMLGNGKQMRRNGTVRPADNIRNCRRKDYKYKIVYNNKMAKDKKLYFDAHASFSKRVHNAIENTNVYFLITNS